MTEDGEINDEGPLAQQWLRRSGLLVKLDKGYQRGTYCVYVEYDELAERVGFTAAHRMAAEYCGLLKKQSARAKGYEVGRTEDASRGAARGRKRDLETTFLAFPLTALDGQYHDEDMKEQFRVALLRSGQTWEQEEAREQADRRDRRQEEFRGRLARLLDGPAYAGLDAATRDRLLAEVPALAFPARGWER